MLRLVLGSSLLQYVTQVLSLAQTTPFAKKHRHICVTDNMPVETFPQISLGTNPACVF